MNHPLKLGAILFLITAICVGILGAVNAVTKPIIKKNETASEEQAMKSLIQNAEHFTEVSEIKNEEIKKISIAKKGEEIVGYVLRLEPNGYGGTIKLLIGISKEGQVAGISILEHSETPGFGANADKDSFKNQFKDRITPLEVTKTKPAEDEVQAITGATITSKAITEAVNEASKYIKDHQTEWGDKE